MKKYNFATQLLSNLIILSVLVALFLACIPKNNISVMSPIYKAENSNNQVSLMINVYQGSEYVEKILEIFDKYDATCTFFVGGIWVEKNVDLLKRMNKIAEIGNHGYLHKDHAKLSIQQNKEEILLCAKLVEKITGVFPSLFAPPSGSLGANMEKVCFENDLKVIMWSKDTIDWRDKDYQLILSRATKNIQSGDMILMHPTEATVKALPLILNYYKQQNLTPVTVSTLLAITP